MSPLFSLEPLAVAAVLLALCSIGLTALRSSLVFYGLQTVALGILATSLGARHGEPLLVIVGLAVMLLKGVAVPIYLRTVARRIGCRRDEGLVVAPPLLMFATLTVAALFALTRTEGDWIPADALPGLALLMIGMLLMMTRRMAVSQIVGFLVLENGAFLYTISQPHAMPTVIELGVLMDVLAGTMLSGLLVFRINDTFEHADVTALKELRG